MMFSPASLVVTTDVGTNQVKTATIARNIITIVKAEGILNVFFMIVSPNKYIFSFVCFLI